MSSFEASINSNVVKKLKALIVDDDTITRMILKALLMKFGVETHEAKNGQEAILAHHSGACFDLILMDLYMQVMNGRQAIKELRDMHVCSLIAGMTSQEKEEREEIIHGC
ncbi:two-component response regulator 24-like [Solanum verrucosum]|uniref:two-component response regulator 24-like n=1 Tax=Solanum verrucosum TaxID=315347 RepID=UPI0020D173C3|nr:two-component response regulator 24-like [Solanum verrucosum]